MNRSNNNTVSKPLVSAKPTRRKKANVTFVPFHNINIPITHSDDLTIAPVTLAPYLPARQANEDDRNIA
jgi:hypothetical protein